MTSVLVTGGTGSLGRPLVRALLDSHTYDRVVVLSRDELKQEEMRREIVDDRLRLMLGDVRDQSRLEQAFDGVTHVIHAAALKQVPAAEYNPHEFVRTNVIGSENVARAAIRAGVKRVVLISTDKAVEPINLYGATKMTAEKIFVAANHMSRTTRLSVVRYGNVIGSRGSVVEMYRDMIRNGRTGAFPVTDPEMTRFWIRIDEAVRFVVSCLASMVGGEIFVPRVRSLGILDVLKALGCDMYEVVGTRPGEKLHETLISSEEGPRACLDLDNWRYVVTPVLASWTSEYQWESLRHRVGVLNSSLRSNTPGVEMSVDDFRKMLA